MIPETLKINPRHLRDANGLPMRGMLDAWAFGALGVAGCSVTNYHQQPNVTLYKKVRLPDGKEHLEAKERVNPDYQNPVAGFIWVHVDTGFPVLPRGWYFTTKAAALDTLEKSLGYVAHDVLRKAGSIKPRTPVSPYPFSMWPDQRVYDTARRWRNAEPLLHEVKASIRVLHRAARAGGVIMGAYHDLRSLTAAIDWKQVGAMLAASKAENPCTKWLENGPHAMEAKSAGAV